MGRGKNLTVERRSGRAKRQAGAHRPHSSAGRFARPPLLAPPEALEAPGAGGVERGEGDKRRREDEREMERVGVSGCGLRLSAWEKANVSGGVAVVASHPQLMTVDPRPSTQLSSCFPSIALAGSAPCVADTCRHSVPLALWKGGDSPLCHGPEQVAVPRHGAARRSLLRYLATLAVVPRIRCRYPLSPRASGHRMGMGMGAPNLVASEPPASPAWGAGADHQSTTPSKTHTPTPSPSQNSVTQCLSQSFCSISHSAQSVSHTLTPTPHCPTASPHVSRPHTT